MSCVFDETHYRVFVTRPTVPSRGTIIYYQLVGPRDPDTGFAPKRAPSDKNFITSAGYTAVMVQPARQDWFQHESFDAALDAIRRIPDLPRPWLSYGTSMGGYGAIVGAAALEADFFLSGSPQASINDAYMRKIKDGRWRPGRAFYRVDPIRNGACAGTKGVVLCDPLHAADQKHALTILRNTDSQQINCPGTAHFGIVRMMRDVGFENFTEQLFDVMAGKETLAAFVNRARQTFDASIPGAFFKADPATQQDMVATLGADAILQSTHISALADHLNRMPSVEYAKLLVGLLPHVAKGGASNYVKRVIGEADMDYLLETSEAGAA
ncbi:hypothetical protein SAMN04488005_1846 [Yoonia tamlensis]|uniref:Alpha/beta hydrolase family protein n=1 Tax=Yoonia tamlensis TaxID=390270 RepID=A0A1I6GLD1_9RHOB|nr:hypothetical protein [Yoonia tamlensis]SFR42980.1 hypothetical protein SAMN04488005_1846 [Yoonia tamlensis]